MTWQAPVDYVADIVASDDDSHSCLEHGGAAGVRENGFDALVRAKLLGQLCAVLARDLPHLEDWVSMGCSCGVSGQKGGVKGVIMGCQWGENGVMTRCQGGVKGVLRG